MDMQSSRDEWSVLAASTRMVLQSKTFALSLEDRLLDGRSIAEIAPEVLKLIFECIQKWRTVWDPLTDSLVRYVSIYLGMEVDMWHPVCCWPE
jgi:hypothetical protein